MVAPEQVAIIEGTAVPIEAPEVRAVAVVQQPGQSLVAHSDRGGPADMVGVAADLATVLKDIVERQKLYAIIQGKKYPQVEAWMTIARLDNVVAREASAPIRHDDGSYEAFAELIRLSDGMVIGASSALCGTPDDKPWASRPEPARRSMAQTRAASRAFRAQYSWIMALAGYEPTPAEEMPHTPTPGSPPPASSVPAAGPPPGSGDTPATVLGIVKRGDGNGMDLELRQTPDGHAIGFKLTDLEGHPRGRKSAGVRAFGPLAVALAGVLEEGQSVTVRGPLRPETIDKKDGGQIHYEVVLAERVGGDFGTVPAEGVTPEPIDDGKVDDLDSLPW